MLIRKQVKSVLNKHKQRDGWFLTEYSVNPYEGCSCNCLYCYVRGSRYGENMSDTLAVKDNAPAILEKQLQLRARKKQYGFVAVGSATDAYIHQEEQEHMTERLLQLLLQYRFPVFISTKRNLITRDVELLKAIDRAAILPPDLQALGRGVILSVSLSTLNMQATDMLEPGAIAPMQRLQLLQQLKEEGFLAGVNAIPLLPFISDTEEEMEQIVAAAAQHRADYILAGGLTLFGNGTADSKTLYYTFLQRYHPDLIPAYDRLYNQHPFTQRQYQDALRQKANRLCHKYQIRDSIM
jgi:DNA repair photolyase